MENHKGYTAPRRTRLRWIAGQTGLPDGEGGTVMCDSYTCPACGGAYPPENVAEQKGRCTSCGFEDTETVIVVPTFRADRDGDVDRVDRFEATGGSP